MMRVIKRGGNIVGFSVKRIENAMNKAGVNSEKSCAMACDIRYILNQRGETHKVEDIQDLVEEVLMRNGYVKEAKAYILYRAERNKQRVPHVQQRTESYVVHYSEAVEFADLQAIKFYWPHTDIDVNKDVQDLRVNLPEEDRKRIIEVLRLFVLYELRVGNDFWLGRYKRIFPRPEFNRLATTNGFMEEQVHAPFYDKINKALFLSNDEFYNSWQYDPVLKQRMDFISEMVNHADDLVAISAFTFIEGAILFSSFAFLKSFQHGGNDFIKNIVAGINFTVRDEDLHCQGSAWSFRVLKGQKNLNSIDEGKLKTVILQVAQTVYEHECVIIDKLYTEGTKDNNDFKAFVQSRIAQCLVLLGYDNTMVVNDNPIAGWFYKSINGNIFHDFFNTTGREYTRDWDKKKLLWHINEAGESYLNEITETNELDYYGE